MVLEGVMVYFAHSREGFSEEHWQSLQEHLRNTGFLAAEFSAKFGADSFGKTAGLLHDIGNNFNSDYVVAQLG